MKFRCEDWRTAKPERIAPLYAAEADRWAAQLGWDARSNFRQIERGRVLGHVRGVLAVDPSGRVDGWSFYLVDHNGLQVGGFVAPSEACSEALLQGIYEDRDAQAARSTTFFTYSDAPGLTQSLRRYGMSVDRYFYLTKELIDSVPSPLRDWCRWGVDSTPAALDLFRRAYPEPDPTRPFAPHGTAAEWNEYVRNLISGDGCGALVPEACVSLPLGPGRLSALAIVTRISETVAHLVQLAVNPTTQKQGIGSSMLLAACNAAYRAGFDRMSLLVSGRNAIARRMYESAGFKPAMHFATGGSNKPFRSATPSASSILLAAK
jgi:ribosomal protein S18 acetylase RimI-like enzyme